MILIVTAVLTILSVPLCGGQLRRIGEVRIRGTWAVALACVLQVVILRINGISHGVAATAHVASYLAIAVLLWENRRLPWLWLVALGGGLNFAAIISNGGVMPASLNALRSSGRLHDHAVAFANSAAVSHAKLAWLGDVFAVPKGWPFANVFSVGDVLLVVGGAFLLHGLAGSRLVRRPDTPGRDFTLVRRNQSFRMLWLSGAVSDLGDWTYSLAVVTILAQRDASPATFAAIFALQMSASALVGMFGTRVVDHFPRTRLIAVTNVAQGAAVASLLLAHRPPVAHFLAVATVLGALGALVRPATMATIPNLVADRDLLAANGLIAATFNLAVTLGPLLGATVVTTIGGAPAIAVNAASFVLSAVLISRIRTPAGATAGGGTSTGHVVVDRRATAGLRHIAGNRMLRALIVMMMFVMFGAAVRAPTEPLFILKTLAAGPGGVGMLAAVWGAGMVLASASAARLGRRRSPEAVLVLSVAVLGAAVATASATGSITVVALLWLCAGSGNALGSVAYETILQERTPDAVRGRVFGAADAVLDVAYLLGAVTAGVIASRLGVRAAMTTAGVSVLCAAVLGLRVLATRAKTAPVPAVRALGTGEVLDARVAPALRFTLAVRPPIAGAVAATATMPTTPRHAYEHWGVPQAVTGTLAVSPRLPVTIPARAADLAERYGWLRVVGDSLPSWTGGGLACRTPGEPGAVIVLDPVTIAALGKTVDEVCAHELRHLEEWLREPAVPVPGSPRRVQVAAADHAG